MYSLLKQLIAIPSTSRNEKEVANFYADYLTSQGFKVNRIENNLWLVEEGYDASLPTVMLNAHIDTVKPVSGWTCDPFTPVEADGRLYGLGSNDCGGGLVALLGAYMQLIRLSTPSQRGFNLIYAASAEEEVSGKNGMELLLTKLPEIDFAVVGEPTAMRLAVAEKGLMVLDCTAHGVAGHAARNEGDNAIYHAIEDIQWFKSYTFPKTSETLGEVKMSVTMIEAGSQHNVVPDLCKFVVDVRTTDSYRNLEALEIIRQHVKCDVSPRSTRLNPSGVPMDHPFVRRALDMGIEYFGSPTLSDQALMSFPSVKFGPGDSARSHTADEFITESEINDAIKTYVSILSTIKL